MTPYGTGRLLLTPVDRDASRRGRVAKDTATPFSTTNRVEALVLAGPAVVGGIGVSSAHRP